MAEGHNLTINVAGTLNSFMCHCNKALSFLNLGSEWLE